MLHHSCIQVEAKSYIELIKAFRAQVPWKSFRRAARRTSNSAQRMDWTMEYSLNLVHTGAHRYITLTNEIPCHFHPVAHDQPASFSCFSVLIHAYSWACSASLLAWILVSFLSFLSAAHSVALPFSILVPAMPLTNVINAVWIGSIYAKFVQIHLSVAQDCLKFQ